MIEESLCNAFLGPETGSWHVSHGTPAIQGAGRNKKVILVGGMEPTMFSDTDTPYGEGLVLNFQFRAGNRYDIVLRDVSKAPSSFDLDQDVGALLEVFATNGLAATSSIICHENPRSPSISDKMIFAGLGASRTISTALDDSERSETIAGSWIPDRDYSQLWLRTRVPLANFFGSVAFNRVEIWEYIPSNGMPGGPLDSGNGGSVEGNLEDCDLARPEGLIAYRSQTGNVLLRWDPIPGAVSYDIGLGYENPDRATNHRGIRANELELSLPPNEYAFNVVANCVDGERSSFSEPFFFNTDELIEDPALNPCLTLTEILRLENDLPMAILGDTLLRYEGQPRMEEEYPGQLYPTVLEDYVYQLVLQVKEQITLMPGVRFTATRDQSYVLRITPCEEEATMASIASPVSFTRTSALPGAVVLEEPARTAVFPNPVRDILTISHPVFEGGVNIQLMDVSGAAMGRYQGTGSQTHLPIGHLKAGTYLLVLQGDEGFRETKKIIKQ